MTKEEQKQIIIKILEANTRIENINHQEEVIVFDKSEYISYSDYLSDIADKIIEKIS